MPRTRQGGNRSGTPGKAYPNRTDIAQQPSLPARAAPGQTYGKATQQLQAQRMVPMAPPRVVLPQPVAPPAGPSGAGPGAPLSPGAAPIPGPAPGAAGDLHRPSERPTEPVTAGSPIGAGPGPEAIPPNSAASPVNNNLSSMLAQLAQASNSDALHALAQAAVAAGQ